MRPIRDVLRLHFREGYRNRKIAKCLSVSASTVSAYLERTKHAGLRRPLLEDLDDHGLESCVYAEASVRHKSEPSMALKLVWQSYRATYPSESLHLE